MISLTTKQSELLDFLKRYSIQNDRIPSFDEMREGLGLASKSGIHRLIQGLEERGFIRRIPNRARCIELVAEPSLPGSGLHSAPVGELVGEMKRRGFVVGYYDRRSFVGIKGEQHSYRTFVEIAA